VTVVEVPTAVEMHDLGRLLGRSLGAGDVVVLSGPLGAGKTTLVKGIAAGMRVGGVVTSPTFVIARVHRSEHGGPDLVHVDAYRVGGRLELDDLDLHTSIADSVTVVEWGEGLAEVLADQPVVIRIDRPDPDSDVRYVELPDSVVGAVPANG
jgi:tRNA threonylcarbamoyladenosine biosynthesis protein TsaE